MKNKKKKSPYTNIGIFWQTYDRFEGTRKANTTQDSFLNKLLDLYDRMVGNKKINKIEKRKGGKR